MHPPGLHPRLGTGLAPRQTLKCTRPLARFLRRGTQGVYEKGGKMYIYDRQLVGSQYGGLGQPTTAKSFPESLYETGARAAGAVRSLFESEPSQPPAVLRTVAPAARELVAVGVQRAKPGARPGLSPEKVCWIQIILNEAERESLKADGIAGPLTREAVRRFQAHYGFVVDGIVRPQTQTALIQTALNRMIAKASVLPVNGVMDARTRQEIMGFQTANNLVPDGIVGPRTRAAMVTALGGRCLIRPSGRPPNGIKRPNGTRPKCDVSFDFCQREKNKCVLKCAWDTGVHNYPIDCLFKFPNALAIAACLVKRGVVHPQIQHLYDFISCTEKGCLPWFRNCQAAARDCKAAAG